MENTWVPRKINGFQWLVQDPELLGGKPAVQGTRMSVSLVLQLLSEEMNFEDIVKNYGAFPKEAIAEVLRYASKISDKPDVAA